MAERLQFADLDFQSSSKAKNLPAPTAGGDAANKDYVDSLIEGLAWKDSVRVASTGNLNLSSPGSSIDSISLSTSDRVLVKDQSSAPENGIYIWNGASSAMTRSPDCSTADELEQATVAVEQGTVNANTNWRQTQVNFTLNSGNVVWEAFGAAVPDASETVKGKIEIATQAETNTGSDDARAVTPLKLASYTGFAKKYATDVGDGSSTSFVVTHNLNSRDVLVQVRLAGSPYDQVDVEVEHTSVNTVTIKTNTAPASSAWRVMVIGG